MIGVLGAVETTAIRKVYGNRIAAFSDLVCYWFEKSRAMIMAGKVDSVGFVATKGIAKNANLPVLVRLAAVSNIFEAWSNEPWVVNGAAVRVSLICFGSGTGRSTSPNLNGHSVARINANLTSGIDTTEVVRLDENSGSVFIGVQKSGPLSVSAEIAEKWVAAPANPNNRKNSEILVPYVSTEDLIGRPQDEFLIDFPSNLSERQASEFEAPFEYLHEALYDARRDGNPVSFRNYRRITAGQNSSYWEAHRVRSGLREALRGVESYVATGETTEHRVFRFLPATAVPDKSLYAFPFAGLTGFGILQSYFHEVWCTYFGNRIGAGNQRRYNASYVYLTFPFPEGLTPNIPAAAYADEARAKAIAAAATHLNELRENWLNPADLVVREPGVVAGYPDRIMPKDEKAAKELKKRTLTNLYNARPQWLANAHAALDSAVADAYGWGGDWRAGVTDDDEILARLFTLNQERNSSRPD